MRPLPGLHADTIHVDRAYPPPFPSTPCLSLLLSPPVCSHGLLPALAPAALLLSSSHIPPQRHLACCPLSHPSTEPTKQRGITTCAQPEGVPVCTMPDSGSFTGKQQVVWQGRRCDTVPACPPPTARLCRPAAAAWPCAPPAHAPPAAAAAPFLPAPSAAERQRKRTSRHF